MAVTEGAFRSAPWRLWALVPIVLIVGTVLLVAAAGGSLVSLVGSNAPQPDELDVRRVVFEPGEIRVRVTNPQQDDITIASVTVDDAIVPFTLDGPAQLGRLRSSTIVIPFQWVEDEPIAVGVTSSTGIETVEGRSRLRSRPPAFRGEAFSGTRSSASS